jgi:release factor glutamine methyltransferase
MTITAWLNDATRQLSTSGVLTARLDAKILLSDVLMKDTSWILTYPDTTLSRPELSKLNNLLKKRTNHEPLAYLRGKSEFYGHEFIITPSVLQPRPESEAIIDELKDVMQDGTFPTALSNVVRIADVGCGSGALGIAAALEIANSSVYLLDIDQLAVNVAKMNVDLFTLKISVILSDLLDNAPPEIDVLLCNLPYVPDDYAIDKSTTYEPEIALFGGKDGLNIYRKLFKQVQNRSSRPLLIITESFPFQHQKLRQIAKNAHYTEEKTNDFVQVFRSS